MLSAFIGVLVCAASIAGICRWWAEVGAFLRGFLPLAFFLAGLVAIVAGLSGKRPPKTD